MQYKDLKEMAFLDWDGKPFLAIVIDDEQTLFATDKMRYDGDEKGKLITGYNNEKWLCDNGLSWVHVYPIEWNKKSKKRMTNRQLAMWLAKGNGQMVYLFNGCLSVTDTSCVRSSHTYKWHQDSLECDDRVRVRKGDSEEWIEPTVDLLND